MNKAQQQAKHYLTHYEQAGKRGECYVVRLSVKEEAAWLKGFLSYMTARKGTETLYGDQIMMWLHQAPLRPQTVADIIQHWVELYKPKKEDWYAIDYNSMRDNPVLSVYYNWRYAVMNLSVNQPHHECYHPDGVSRLVWLYYNNTLHFKVEKR